MLGVSGAEAERGSSCLWPHPAYFVSTELLKNMAQSGGMKALLMQELLWRESVACTAAHCMTHSQHTRRLGQTLQKSKQLSSSLGRPLSEGFTLWASWRQLLEYLIQTEIEYCIHVWCRCYSCLIIKQPTLSLKMSLLMWFVAMVLSAGNQ